MSRVLEILSRQIGRDAREAANEHFPELSCLPLEAGDEVAEAVEEVLDSQGWPLTAEHCARAYQVLCADGRRLQEIGARYGLQPSAQPSKYAGFTPDGPAEQDFLENASADELREYFLWKEARGE